MQPKTADPEHSYSLPSEVLASLSERDDVAELNEAWNLAGSARLGQPDEAWVLAAGSEIRRVLRAAVRPRAIIRPMRFALSVAACLAILVAIGLALQPGTKTLTVPHGGQLTHVLPDGSLLKLNSGSKLTYQKEFGDNVREVQLVRGEGEFVVTESPTPFLVQTFNGAVDVVGTSFNVRAWPDDAYADITVTSGRVRITPGEASGKSMILTAGQSARMRASDTAPVLLQTGYLERAPSWQSGSFIFPDQPVGVVIREIERRYNVKIDVAPQSFVQERIAIFIEEPGSAEQILREVCELKSCQLRVVPDGLEITAATPN